MDKNIDIQYISGPIMSVKRCAKICTKYGGSCDMLSGSTYCNSYPTPYMCSILATHVRIV